MTTSIPDLRWRHNGTATINSLNGNKTYTIDVVSTDDAGIYECHERNHRDDGNHAIFQLIVRGMYQKLCNSICVINVIVLIQSSHLH